MILTGVMFGAIILCFVVSSVQVHGNQTDKLAAKKLAIDISAKIDQMAAAGYDSSVRVDLPKEAKISISENKVVAVELGGEAGAAQFSASGASPGTWDFAEFVTVSRHGASLITLEGA